MDRSVTALLVPDEVGPNPANVSARGFVVGTRPDLSPKSSFLGPDVSSRRNLRF